MQLTAFNFQSKQSSFFHFINTILAVSGPYKNKNSLVKNQENAELMEKKAI